MTGQDYSLYCREGVFSETQLPIRGVLGNPYPDEGQALRWFFVPLSPTSRRCLLR
jgi:hypothetical protein